MENVCLIDVETNKTYYVSVNNEDAEKARKGMDIIKPAAHDACVPAELLAF